MSKCKCCPRPSDIPMCTVCWASLRDKLGRTDDIVEDLELTRVGQDKIGGVPIGRVSGGGGSRLPVREHVAPVVNRLRETLGSWMRDLWETHAIRWQQCDGCEAQWFGGDQLHGKPDCTGAWAERIAELGQVDTSARGLARWILRHQSWVTMHPAADQLYRELTGAYVAALRVIDRPDDRVYLGICSADQGDGEYCEVDLFARESQDWIRCSGCGSVRNVNERRELLTAAVDHQYLPTGLVIAAVGRRGHRLTSSMLRNYRARERLTAYVLDPDAQPDAHGHRVRPMVEGDDQVALYRVSEVVDVLTTKHHRKKAMAEEAL